ncbi:WSC domain-containing protein [Astrocystis sublimbata]|nr:WSC domain-containing protein [Astrocystis sublimbata]
MLRQLPHPLVSLLLTLTTLLPSTAAQSSTHTSTSTSTTSSSSTSPSSHPTLAIGSADNTIYAYAGCFNESAGLPNTTGLRALDGPSEVKEGEMTVALCLAFCAQGDPQQNHVAAYRYAGLEYSRECWCGDELNPLVTQLKDGACDFPCDGDKTTACGGQLKLSLYNVTSEKALTEGSGGDKNGAMSWGRDGAWNAMLVGSMVSVMGLALGSL